MTGEDQEPERDQDGPACERCAAHQPEPVPPAAGVPPGAGEASAARVTASEPEAPPAPPAPPCGPPAPTMGELASKLDRLLDLFERRLTYDGGKEELIRRLNEELTAYRDDWVRRQKRPLLLDLVLLYDSLRAVHEGLAQRESLTGPEVGERLQVLGDELLEVLARQDVLPYDEHPASLDRRRHRTLGTEPAATAEEHDQVARIVRPGFTWGDGVLRPEEVVLKKFAPIGPRHQG